jgi:hypothetical protein
VRLKWSLEVRASKFKEFEEVKECWTIGVLECWSTADERLENQRQKKAKERESGLLCQSQ